MVHYDIIMKGILVMTVAQMITELSKMPPDAKVYYEGGEYKDDWRLVHEIDLQKHGTLGKNSGVYIK
jgi:hypothetical protein